MDLRGIVFILKSLLLVFFLFVFFVFVPLHNKAFEREDIFFNKLFVWTVFPLVTLEASHIPSVWRWVAGADGVEATDVDKQRQKAVVSASRR